MSFRGFFFIVLLDNWGQIGFDFFYKIKVTPKMKYQTVRGGKKLKWFEKKISPFSRHGFCISGSQNPFSGLGIVSLRVSAEPGSDFWWCQFSLAWTPKYIVKRAMHGGSDKPEPSPLCKMKNKRTAAGCCGRGEQGWLLLWWEYLHRKSWFGLQGSHTRQGERRILKADLMHVAGHDFQVGYQAIK